MSRASCRPYTVDESVHRRFDRRKVVFHRRRIYTGFDHYRPPGEPSSDPQLPLLAEARASWLVHDCFTEAFTDSMVSDQRLLEGIAPFRYEFPDAGAATDNLLGVAGRFGASLAGVTRLRHRWLYSHERTGEPVELPEGVSWVLVMAIEMDPDWIARSPGFEAAAATGRGYSAMASLASSVAEYLRLLGYYARSSGNDTALSIPLAVDAGLGVQGRNGLLLTRRFGPRVRICKIFTNLEMVPTPLRYGAYPHPEELCADCTLCAEACEANALSMAPSPSFEVITESNNPGVLRWPFDPERCFDLWLRMGRDCSNCISSCPGVERLAELMDRPGPQS